MIWISPSQLTDLHKLGVARVVDTAVEIKSVVLAPRRILQHAFGVCRSGPILPILEKVDIRKPVSVSIQNEYPGCKMRKDIGPMFGVVVEGLNLAKGPQFAHVEGLCLLGADRRIGDTATIIRELHADIREGVMDLLNKDTMPTVEHQKKENK